MKVPDFTPLSQKHFGFEHPAVYSIQVIGCLEKSWSKRLGGLNIVPLYATINDEKIVVTALTGELLDQAALIGVLNALYNLRLTIWSVECLGTPME